MLNGKLKLSFFILFTLIMIFLILDHTPHRLVMGVLNQFHANHYMLGLDIHKRYGKCEIFSFLVSRKKYNFTNDVI